MKRETVAEFLARGGKITKVPTNQSSQKVEVVRSTNSGPASITTMDQADLYHGEYKPRKTKKRIAKSTIDISALPEELRKKFIDGVIREQEEND